VTTRTLAALVCALALATILVSSLVFRDDAARAVAPAPFPTTATATTIINVDLDPPTGTTGHAYTPDPAGDHDGSGS
jgi:hypothetical protein